MSKNSLQQTQEFLGVVKKLRKQCPWDKKQTHQSLLKYLIEETYETVEAIESKKPDKMKEELGDLLLQIALHAEIASEKKWFSFEDISETVKEKMIERHPHVFGNAVIKTAEEQTANWEKIKREKKEFLLEGIPKALPALQLAQKFGDVAATIGFDWKTVEGVTEKISEEIQELQVEIEKGNKQTKEEELGDLLFTLTRLASHLGLDAEMSLKRACNKFETRFKQLENKVKQSGEKSPLPLEALDEFWNQIKLDERQKKLTQKNKKRP